MYLGVLVWKFILLFVLHWFCLFCLKIPLFIYSIVFKVVCRVVFMYSGRGQHFCTGFRLSPEHQGLIGKPRATALRKCRHLYVIAQTVNIASAPVNLLFHIHAPRNQNWCLFWGEDICGTFISFVFKGYKDNEHRRSSCCCEVAIFVPDANASSPLSWVLLSLANYIMVHYCHRVEWTVNREMCIHGAPDQHQPSTLKLWSSETNRQVMRNTSSEKVRSHLRRLSKTRWLKIGVSL